MSKPAGESGGADLAMGASEPKTSEMPTLDPLDVVKRNADALPDRATLCGSSRS